MSTSSIHSSQGSSAASPSASPSSDRFSSTARVITSSADILSSSAAQRISSKVVFSSTSAPKSTISSTSAQTIVSLNDSLSTSNLFNPSSPIASNASSTAPVSSGTSTLHRTTLIAAVSASLAGVTLLALITLFLFNRSHSRRYRDKSGILATQHQDFLPPSPAATNEKGWTDHGTGRASYLTPDSAPVSPAYQTFTEPIPVRHTVERTLSKRQSTFSMRSGMTTTTTAAKGPHYTVRSGVESGGSRLGFGNDIAWQDAHYENPLPVTDRIGGALPQPAIDVVPPTPRSPPPGIVVRHDMPVALPLLRITSAASSASSQYSVASMGVNLPDPRRASLGEEPALADDGRDWRNLSEHHTESNPQARGPRQLI